MQKQIERKQLLRAVMDRLAVTSVDVRQITFEPGQETGRHLHPCPVVGYIARGSAVFQIEEQAAQELPEGSAFYEPADAVILRFDNASATDPMTFIAFYLLDGEQELIRML
jgi:quercetin dioxygenase-like cupin family protein